ncbi:DUF3857 domain-containing protein [Myroides sp. DW712]|uniref:DUF3857 domain-containing protein n=1 Tax=Myroides sp. DW712 TaxID=3389800 RepID=UPI00397BB245
MYRYCWVLLLSFSLFAQKNSVLTTEITDEYKQNAYSIINEERVEVKVTAIDRFSVKTRKVITVLNEKGLEDLGFDEYYNKNRKIKSIQVSVLDEQGKSIRSLKQKDFTNYSLSQDMNITDSRLLRFDYRPANYPVVFVFESEVEAKNTAFLPKWYPIQGYQQSVLYAVFSVEVPADIAMNAHLFNPSFYPIEKTTTATTVQYTMRNFPALVHESLAPSLQQFVPKVLVALNKVNLEGVNASFSSWEELGNWYYQHLIKGTDVLSTETKKKVHELVQGVEDPVEKAKILYAYMQERTRYISIQLGIGGWKPMLAKDVDILGYGDCKGLTNYLRALLKEAGVQSYPVLVYGSATPLNIEKEVVCLQGNHMILALPLGDSYQWIECTSQKSPFGYIGGFTDNRDVLVVKETGSELVRTKHYTLEESKQESNATIVLDEQGNAKVNLHIESIGIQFDNRFFISSMNSKDKERAYKRLLDDFKNVQFSKLETSIEKSQVKYIEDLDFTADRYAQKLGDRLVFSLANWNATSAKLTNARNRITPFTLQYDWKDTDEVEIKVPEGYDLDILPSPIDIKSKYGIYRADFEYKDQKLFYKRTRHNIGGIYEKEDYMDYRAFREKINNADQVKIVLKKQK